jgi:hypothetical protein
MGYKISSVNLYYMLNTIDFTVMKLKLCGNSGIMKMMKYQKWK